MERARDDHRRIQWILEQSIKKRIDPGTLDSRWKDLSDQMRADLSRDPKGDLALPAMRAALRTSVLVSPFGLLNDPPDLSFQVDHVLTLGQEFLVRADVEASVDGAPWTPIASLIVDDSSRRGREGVSTSLSKIYPDLTAGPHRLQFRSKQTLFDIGAISKEELARLFGRAGGIKLRLRNQADPWPSLGEQSKMLFSETSPIGDASTLLFQAYPEDFPHAISALSTPVSSFFAPSKILITELELPPPAHNAMAFAWNSKSYCVAQRDVAAGQILGVELFGRFADDAPIALAGNAELRGAGSGSVLVSFPVALGFDSVVNSSNLFTINTYSETGEGTSYARLPFFSTRGPTWRQALPAESHGISKGQLTIKPSREIARRTKMFESYFGQAISIPVQVEVKSIKAFLLKAEKCP